MKTKAESVINELYYNESVVDESEVFNTKYSVRTSVEVAAMFTAIAERFGITRFDLIEPALTDYATELFLALSEADRAKVAETADKESTTILARQGVDRSSMLDCARAGTFKGESAYWRHFITSNENEIEARRKKSKESAK